MYGGGGCFFVVVCLFGFGFFDSCTLLYSEDISAPVMTVCHSDEIMLQSLNNMEGTDTT